MCMHAEAGGHAEEQQVAIEVQVSAHQEENPWEHRVQNVLASAVPSRICVIFLWYLAWWEWVWEIPTACETVCPSHGNILFYWAILPVDCYEDDFFPKLYCLIDNNNNVSLNRVLMIKKNKTRSVTQLEHVSLYGGIIQTVA